MGISDRYASGRACGWQADALVLGSERRQWRARVLDGRWDQYCVGNYSDDGHWSAVLSGVDTRRSRDVRGGHQGLPQSGVRKLEDLFPESGQDQLHSKMSRLVLHIEDGIDFGDLEGCHLLRVRDHLHGEMRFSVTGAASDGRGYAG